MWLTRFAIKNPTIVTLFFLAVALFGTIGYMSMGENIVPSVQEPKVYVSAYYPGASPEEMERLVVRPIEDQVQDVAHVDKVTASAQDGVANISISFKVGTDIKFSSTDVQQAVDQARIYLPSDLIPPVVSRDDTATQPIIIESASSKTLSPSALSDLVDNQLIPQLRGARGVGSVTVGGKFTRQATIEPDVGRLRALGATLLDVNNAVASGNVSLPGGRLDAPYQEATVGIRADITDPLQIAKLPLAVPGSRGDQIRVGDVSHVIDGYADHRIVSNVNGENDIVMAIARDADGDTRLTTENVRKTFAGLQAKYPAVKFTELSADETFMHDALNGVLQNLLEGVVLTALVLLFFLHVWRSALVVMIAIPASLLATFFVMWTQHLTIDLLSLMGLSLTVGILVDDSIVVIENITRHREMGKPPEEAALVGRTEIGGAAIAITLVDVVVFAPIAFMQGVTGQWLHEFGFVIVVATLFSLLVSFTLTPLLAARWAVVRMPGNATREGKPSFTALVSAPVNAFAKWFDRVRQHYHDVTLPRAIARPWLVVAGCFGLVVASIVPLLLGWIPTEFQPDTPWGGAVVDVTYPAGTPISTTLAGADRLESQILKIDGVKYVSVDVGQQSGALGGNIAEMYVTLDPKKRQQEYAVRALVPTMGYLVPGARIEATGFQNGGFAPINYTLAGPPGTLDEGANRLKALIAKQPSALDVKTSTSNAGPRMEVAVDRDRASLLDVSPDAAAQTARAGVGGAIATKLRMPEGLIDAVVRLPSAQRNDLQTVEGLDVRSNTGRLVPLSDVATFKWTTEPTMIQREDRQRTVTVSANTVNGAPIGPITSKVVEALAQPNFLPPGVTVKPEGDVQLQQETGAQIGLALLTSFVLIYMLMVVLYRSYLTPFIIMFSVPLAFIGVLGFLLIINILHNIFPGVQYLRGQTLNLFSELGVVMLMGLVAKNGILLVDYANTLRARGMKVVEAIRESAFVRFRPIVMTTAAMIFGMLPLALGITEGAEFRKSIGTVIIGGLTSSLLLTLFLVPAVYVIIVGWVDRRAERREQRDASVRLSDDGDATPAELARV